MQTADMLATAMLLAFFAAAAAQPATERDRTPCEQRCDEQAKACHERCRDDRCLMGCFAEFRDCEIACGSRPR